MCNASWEFSEANDNTAKRNALYMMPTVGPEGDRTGRFPFTLSLEGSGAFRVCSS